MELNAFGQKIYYADYTWREMEALDRAKVKLVLPSGSVEQHGAHLTMASDATQATEFAKRAAVQVKDVIVLPALWYSTCLDTSNFTGTISLNPGVFAEHVIGIITSLHRNGFRKLVIGNVHGAAKTPLDFAVREFHARMGTRDKAYADDFFIHIHNCYAPVVAYLNSFADGKDWGHACEMETSADLYLNPDRVYMDKAVEDYIPWEKGFEWYIGDMRAVNKSGVHGAAQAGSAEKGERIVAAIVEAYADILKRV